MIIIKTKREIEILRQGGKILAAIFKKIAKEVKPGITTGYLENLAVGLIKEAGGRPSFLNYKSLMETKAFPTALCTSINSEVVHAPALPSRKLSAGDIIGIDIGMEYPFGPDVRGYYTDMATTVAVGKINRQARRLLAVTKKSLELAIKTTKPGIALSAMSKVIQEYVESQGLSVVRDLVGHGVGTAVHEEPQIPNYVVESSNSIVLKPGMVLAIEPMVNLGGSAVKSLRDGFTIVTADGSLSAHFEHTVVVTEKGCEILTE